MRVLLVEDELGIAQFIRTYALTEKFEYGLEKAKQFKYNYSSLCEVGVRSH
jgi:DNA-binding response OmpR family regulator